MFRSLLPGLGLLLASSVGLCGDDLGGQQVWKSADGRKITAEVLQIDLDAGKVKMARSDGLIFTIGFDRFAGEDAARLRKAALERLETDPRSGDEPEPTDPPKGRAPLPDRLELDDVPMVRQKGNFCVPASAAMIAGFHGIDTDQDQIAFLSSQGSFNNEGTNPRDMFLAMQKLGFDGRALYWRTPEDFQAKALPSIRRALAEEGPIYISFKPGVFGSSGHGCIIIGYHDRKEELIFHNPWGNVFEKEYQDVATQAHGIVMIFAPEPAPVADEAYLEKIKARIPAFAGSIVELTHLLKAKGLGHELVWCSRRDAREDERFAADTARDDGRKILDLAFHRNPAVFLPANQDGETVKYHLVTRPPEGGARFMVRELTAAGWSDPDRIRPRQVYLGTSHDRVASEPLIPNSRGNEVTGFT